MGTLSADYVAGARACARQLRDLRSLVPARSLRLPWHSVHWLRLSSDYGAEPPVIGGWPSGLRPRSTGHTSRSSSTYAAQTFATYGAGHPTSGARPSCSGALPPTGVIAREGRCPPVPILTSSVLRTGGSKGTQGRGHQGTWSTDTGVLQARGFTSLRSKYHMGPGPAWYPEGYLCPGDPSGRRPKRTAWTWRCPCVVLRQVR